MYINNAKIRIHIIGTRSFKEGSQNIEMIGKIYFFLCYYFVVAHSNRYHIAGKYYGVSFPFSIDGKQYFYNQNLKNNYQIQELLLGGTVGEVTDFGSLQQFYDVQLAYSVGGKQYFYGHRKNTDDWFIRELLPSGKIGGIKDTGKWPSFYDT